MSEESFTLTPNKSYFYLLHAELSSLTFLETYNTESDYITITFTDQNGRPLEIEDKKLIWYCLLKKRNYTFFIEPKTRK